MQFIYEAQDAEGRLIKGTIEAPSDVKAAEILKGRELLLLSLRLKPAIWELPLSLLKRVSARDRAIFARQLSTMISAGLPLSQSLRILVEQTSNANLREAVKKIVEDLEAGFSFSMAIARHSYIFSPFFINMIRSGEASGNLDKVLSILADQQEKDAALIGKVRGALAYPAFIVFALIVVGIVMMIYVIPNLKSMFEQAGASLPITTRILIATADFLKGFWWLVFLALAGLIVGLMLWIRTAPGRYAWHYNQIYTPLIKTLFRPMLMARFTRTASMLVLSGVPILETLQITASVLDNEIYEKLLATISSQVEKGVPMSVSMRRAKLFPPMVVHMISVGEQTGKLDYILKILADFYEEETDSKVKNLATLIEPVILLIMGAAVAFLLVSIMLPLYQMTQQVGG